jgi:2-methylisocitrate lyase-like PEP mutase family enzyme
MDVAEAGERANAFRALHHQGRPLVLTNVWDVAGARVVEQAGFPAIATSSGAVAAALGFEDADSMPADAAFAAVERIAAAVSVPVTGDMEAGYGLAPNDFVRRLLEAGAVGCNYEDTDHHGDGDLVDAEAHASRLHEIKEHGKTLGVNFVLNARVDVFAHRDPHAPETLDEALKRARLYVEAGADCVFPIRLSDDATIGEFVSQLKAPINIMMGRDTPSIDRLAELGVARVSFAGWLMRKTYGALFEDVSAIAKEAGI